MKKFLNPLLLCAVLALLPNCGGDKEHTCPSCPASSQAVTGEALVSFDGKPVVSVEEFEKSIELIKKQQPQFDQLLASMAPEQQAQFLYQVAENLAQQRVRCECVERTGETQTREYQEELDQVLEAVKREMADRKFQENLLKEIAVSDSEARSYYNEKKDTAPAFKRPPFVKSMGGVKAQGVKAANEKDAEALATKARAAGDLAKAAQELKKTVTEFGLVNQMSGNVDAAIRAKLNEVKRTPAIEVVKAADGSFWVVKALSKEDAAYAPFDEIKEQVKELITMNVLMKHLENVWKN